MSLVGSVFQSLEVMPSTEVRNSRQRAVFLGKDHELIVNIKGIFEVSELKVLKKQLYIHRICGETRVLIGLLSMSSLK